MRLGLSVFLLASGVVSVWAHDPIGTKVTWNREIAPIVQARCVRCHSDSGPAPMSLATYDEARPWARAIREEVLARRMPKWPVVRGYGDFLNDPSLSPFEIALITSWVDGGAPETLKTSTRSRRPSFAPAGPMAPPLATETRTLECSTQSLREGRLDALRPSLPKGTSLRLTIAFADGAMEPLLYVRGFDPRFVETYRLRTPISVKPGTRLIVDASAAEGCTIGVLGVWR